MILNRCPNIGDYRRMIDNQLSAGEFERLEFHLEHCSSCQQQLDSLTAFADTAWMPPTPRRPIPNILPSIAGIEIQGEVGRGGYGVVYRGYQPALARFVAVKMLRYGTVSTDNERNRFLEEAKTAAQLQHPHISQVHAVDYDATGNPYLLMEFVEGVSLARRLREGPLAVNDAVKLVQTIAIAVGYAHEQKVIHRDLKPGNILLAGGTFDRPVVTDFGLAKRLDAPTGLTHTVESLGTPSYMPPELAAGGAKAAGPTADVYSLGVILYECLTGHPPFRGATSFDTLLMVRNFDPVPLRQIIPLIDRDIETVCLKCLEKTPADRYPTARALAEDLHRILEHRPILARSVTLIRRITKWRRRHPIRAASVGIVILAMSTIGTAVAWHSSRLAEQQNQLRAEGLVKGLINSETNKLPGRIQELEPYRRWADPLLAEVIRTSEQNSPERLHAALALASQDPAQEEYLMARLLDAQPQEVGVIIDALSDTNHLTTDRWWSIATNLNATPGHRVRAMCVLTKMDASDPRLVPLAPFLASFLASENPFHLSHWLGRLQPIMPVLAPKLAQMLVDPRRDDAEKQQIASMMVATDTKLDPNVLCDAEPRIFRTMFPKLRSGDQTIIVQLRAIASRTPTAGMSENERVTLSCRASRAAIALARLGEYDILWSLLVHSPNPTTRSFLIERLGPYGFDPNLLAAKLYGKTPKSVCRAIVLALGGYGTGEIPAELQHSLTERLLTSYKMDPDAGYHSAIDWLLRQKWGQGDELDRINSSLADKPSGGKRWWINRNGQTFSVLKGPHRIVTGSPLYELQRHTVFEQQYEYLIPRTFVIGTREVTVADYRKFDPTIDKDVLRVVPGNGSCPISVNPVAAMRYCNWLSEKEGIPAEDRVYPQTVLDNFSTMSLPEDYLSRLGYRLPTSAEWELACRGDTTTSRFYGEGTQLMKGYGWTLTNSEEELHPVGEKYPNELGLFDVFGNLWELTHPTQSDQKVPIDSGMFKDLPSQHAFYTRGGSYLYLASFARSAKIYPRNAKDHDQTVGFRIARTIQVHPINKLPWPK